MVDHVKTLGPNGVSYDYTSVTAWQNDHGGSSSKDLVTNGDSVTLEFYKGDYTSVGGGVNFIDETVSITGWTVDDPNGSGTNTMTLTCPASERHDGTPDTGMEWRQSTANFGNLGLSSGSSAIVEFLEFGHPLLGGASRSCIAVTLGAIPIIRNCIFKGSGKGNAADGIVWSGRTSGKVDVANCLFFDFQVAVWRSSWSFGAVRNCTFVRCTTAHEQGVNNYGTTETYNCVAYDCDEFLNPDYVNSFSTGTGYNASDNITGGSPSHTMPPDNVGSSNYASNVVAGDFEDAANDDFHLSSGSPLIGIGFDASSLYTNDIDGDTRTGSWDIGADEFSGSAPAPTHKPQPIWF